MKIYGLMIVMMLVNSIAKGHDDFVDVIPRVKPSIVTIEVRRSKSRSRSKQQEELKEVLGEHADFFSEEVKNLPDSSSGSGFVILNKNQQQRYLTVLTAAHVVEKASEITLFFADGEKKDAEIIWIDESSDVAMLRAEYPDFNGGLELDDSPLFEGKPVLAISGAFGFSLSSSVGIVSAIDVSVGSKQRLIQTDAAINPGSSGGPIFNKDGKVIGLISAIYSSTGTFSGAAFAIPAKTINSLLAR